MGGPGAGPAGFVVGADLITSCRWLFVHMHGRVYATCPFIHTLKPPPTNPAMMTTDNERRISEVVPFPLGVEIGLVRGKNIVPNAMQ